MMWKVLLVMGNIQKWGFGMAPIKPETEKKIEWHYALLVLL